MVIKHPADEWIAYCLGAGLTLFYKWGRYVYIQHRTGLPIKQAAWDWFFEESAANYTSWITTVAVVWVGGAVYINKVGVGWFLDKALDVIPMHIAIAFFLGNMMELVAPNVAKWFVGKLPFAK